MARNNLRRVEQGGVDPAPAAEGVLDVDSIADASVARALDFCARMMGLDNSGEAVVLLRQGYNDVLSRFQYGLARQVAAELGAVDGDVNSVSIYDTDVASDESGDDAALDPMIHLIVCASRKTAALTSLVAALDRALVEHYADLLKKPQLAHLLDVQIVDDTEVSNRTGYAALLSSTYHRPIQVWTR